MPSVKRRPSCNTLLAHMCWAADSPLCIHIATVTVRDHRCVVCGDEEHYLRYRVVPSCYRRHFPVHLKSHRSHDVVLLCVPCHQIAHQVRVGGSL